MEKVKRNWDRRTGVRMNIILIGMRGSGKTTIGKLLSEKLNKTFYDLDTLLALKENMPISKIVEKQGWDYFRDQESEIVEKIFQETNAVISTGGGVILRQKNIAALGKNGTFIFLKASVSEITKRINKGKNRPSLTGKKSFIEELEDIWNERKQLYNQTANIIIETDNKTFDEITHEIMQQL